MKVFDHKIVFGGVDYSTRMHNLFNNLSIDDNEWDPMGAHNDDSLKARQSNLVITHYGILLGIR